MVSLISQSRLDSLGIDTVERALVFSALKLRLVSYLNSSPDSTSQDIKIGFKENGKSEVNIELDVSLSFDVVNFALEGGSLLQNISELDTSIQPTIPSFTFNGTRSNPSSPRIPSHNPLLINTFEKYFFRNAKILSNALPQERNKIVRFDFKDSVFTDPKIRILVSLPLDLNDWLSGKNLVMAVKRVTQSYVNQSTNPPNNTVSTIDNNTILNNTILISN